MDHADHPGVTAEGEDWQDERWQLVQRIVGSRHLLKAPQLREILLYISRRSLSDSAASISEQEIGCKALGRRPDFNPNEDNIVRVQVRHLRRKLEEYFASEGTGEPTLMTIPKGGYLPRFEPRADEALPESAAAPAEVVVAVAPAVAGADAQSAARRGWRRVLLAACLVALVFGVALAWKRPAIRPTSAADTPLGRTDPLWSKIFVPGHVTNIVLADSCLAAVQDVLDVDIRLNDYLSGAYPEKLIQSVPDAKLRAALELIASRQYTSLGDAALASKLMELSRRYGAQINIRYARFLSVREFKSGNFILVGSRRGIPWEQLFEPQLNFVMEEDRSRHAYFFRNKSPKSDEPAAFAPVDAKDPDTYADISLLPNLAGTGYVLILSGIDMAGTEAAGELVTGPEFSDLLAKMPGQASGSAPASYVEMLMQAKAVAGTTQAPKIIAYRVVRESSLSAAAHTGGADLN